MYGTLGAVILAIVVGLTANSAIEALLANVTTALQ